MARVSTNFVTLRYCVETSAQVPPTSGWRLLEPNGFSGFGAKLESVARRPISPIRGRRKGSVVKLDSTASFEHDFTMQNWDDFAEGYIFSEYANVEFDLTHAKLKGSALNATGTGYAFGAQLNTFTNGTLLAGKMVYAASGAITLVWAKGYAIAANNGLKPLNADVTGTSTEVTVTGLSVETAPANAVVFVAGLRTDDLTLTISGSSGTLVSAGDITNWATYGLRAGQFIHIGSGTSAGDVQNAYSSNTVYGYARISSISGGTLNLDKLDPKLTGGPHSPATIDVMFCRFVRNVAQDAASDDSRFLERYYQFEATYKNLGGVGTDEYEYPDGNLANTLVLNMPLTDKAVVQHNFVGLNTAAITASRKTGPSTAMTPLRTAMVGTAQDIAVLTTDLTSSYSEALFAGLTVTINNNVQAERALGYLQSIGLPTGLFEINFEGDHYFTNKNITNAIRDNDTVTAHVILKDADGAVCIDVPSATANGGEKEYPVDQSVRAKIQLLSFTHETLGYDVGVSTFVGVPTSRP